MSKDNLLVDTETTMYIVANCESITLQELADKVQDKWGPVDWTKVDIEPICTTQSIMILL